MGVIFASPGKKDRIVGATLNYEIDELEDDLDDDAAEEGGETEEEATTDESTVHDQVSSDTDRDDEGA